MKRLFKYIQQRLELRLGLLIVLIITVVFSLLFDFLFYRCKQYIQHAAIDRATQLLDNTVEHINGIMEETELVTNFLAVTVPHSLHPDSLLVFSRFHLDTAAKLDDIHAAWRLWTGFCE